MLPALWTERLAALRSDKRDRWPAGSARKDAANPGDPDSADAARNARGSGCRKEQFVVFSAVEGLRESGGGVDGEHGGFNFGGYGGLLTDVGEVGGEAVAQIDGGRGHGAPLEPEALGDTRLGKEMRGQECVELPGDFWRTGTGVGCCQFGEASERGGGCAQSTGYIKLVAGPSAGTQQGFASGNPANEHDVGHGYGRLGQIAARKRCFVSCRKSEQALEKSLNPRGTPSRLDREIAGQTERKKGGDGTRAHGGQVA